MLTPDMRASFPQPPLAGDDWAQGHPEEHAREAAAAKTKVAAALERLKTTGSVTLGELDSRTTQDRLNEKDRRIRRLDEE